MPTAPVIVAPKPKPKPAPPPVVAAGPSSAQQPASAKRADRPAPEFKSAVDYVNRIKARFSDNNQTYNAFLQTLQSYQQDRKTIQEVEPLPAPSVCF